MLSNKLGQLVLVLGVASCVCSCGSNNTTGATSTGGTIATGGASATGGNASGGAVATGGSAKGGASAVGGSAMTGGAVATGGTSAKGGAPAVGGSATTGGAVATGGTSAKGGAPAAGGSAMTGGAIPTGGSGGGGATGAAITTLAQACAHNCTLASGLASCSSTQDVCVQSCLTTFNNTSAINPDLGTQYTTMMVCVANNPAFSSSAAFLCAKPNSPLNLWSPAGLDVVPNSTCEDDICLWNCNDATHGDMDPFVDIRCTCSSV